jgi:hypothetical protein
MANALPMYYVQSMQSIPARNVYNRKVDNPETKRFHWTKEYTKLYKQEKTRRSLNNKEKFKNNSKNKSLTTIESIDNLYTFCKYPKSQLHGKNNDNSKKGLTLTNKEKNNNGLTNKTTISGIYNIKEFDKWCKKTIQKQERAGKTTKEGIDTSNYFNSLATDNKDIHSTKDKGGTKKIILTDSKGTYKEHIEMPRLVKQPEEQVSVPMMEVDQERPPEDNAGKSTDNEQWEVVKDKETN